MVRCRCHWERTTLGIGWRPPSLRRQRRQRVWLLRFSPPKLRRPVQVRRRACGRHARRKCYPARVGCNGGNRCVPSASPIASRTGTACTIPRTMERPRNTTMRPIAHRMHIITGGASPDDPPSTKYERQGQRYTEASSKQSVMTELLPCVRLRSDRPGVLAD